MNNNILKILIRDTVTTGLQERLGVSETAANQIVDDILKNISEMAENGASMAEIVQYLVVTEKELPQMASQVKALAYKADIAQEFLANIF